VAEALGAELQVDEVRRGEDLDRILEIAQSWRAEALNVLASPLLHALRQAIIDQAAVHRLPAIYQWEESARAGGLMSYGPVRRDVYQAIARQLGRVLKGAPPAELPVEQPTKFELVINLKTAKVLNLEIPPTLLGRADEVISKKLRSNPMSPQVALCQEDAKALCCFTRILPAWLLLEMDWASTGRSSKPGIRPRHLPERVVCQVKPAALQRRPRDAMLDQPVLPPLEAKTAAFECAVVPVNVRD
jgi:ABC transporter substrate binding protein